MPGAPKVSFELLLGIPLTIQRAIRKNPKKIVSKWVPAVSRPQGAKKKKQKRVKNEFETDFLGGRFDIFYFFAFGRGEGEVRGAGRGSF